MRRWQNGLLALGVICCIFALLGGCDYLGLEEDDEFTDDGGNTRSGQGTPTPTPKDGDPANTPKPTDPPPSTKTPTPNTGGVDFVVQGAGDMMDPIDLRARISTSRVNIPVQKIGEYWMLWAMEGLGAVR